MCGSVEMVYLLLKAGANPNSTTRDAYTALHIAARDGRADIVQCLLTNGANPDARTKVNDSVPLLPTSHLLFSGYP